MKIRVGGSSIGWLSFGSYDGSGNPSSADDVFRRSNSPNLRGAGRLVIGQWVTYIIDLNSIDTTYYKPNDPTTTHASFGLQIMYGAGGKETDYVDLAYFAICDDWTEIGAVIGDDEATYVTSWMADNGTACGCYKDEHTYPSGSNICSICQYEHVCLDPTSHYTVSSTGHTVIESCDLCGVTASSAEVPHTITTLETVKGEEATTYTYHCDICKGKVREWTVSNNVNYYSAPSQTYNNWASGDKGASCVQTGVISSDGTYNRIKIGAGASFEFVNGSMTPIRSFGVQQTVNGAYDAGDTIEGGSGRYLVLRYRVHGPQLLKLLLNSSNPDSTANLAGNVVSIALSRIHGETQDTWRTIVIDIETLGSTYYHAEDETVTNIAAGLYFDAAGNLASVPEAERYVDVAYFAVCDNMSEVAAVVGEDTVEYYANFISGAAQPITCHKGEHTVGDGEDVCSVCGEAQN